MSTSTSHTSAASKKGTTGPLPVVLVCGAATVLVADRVVTALQERGHSSEVVVIRAQAEATLLDGPALRFADGALYVVCRGAELGRDAVDLLRARLKHFQIPFERTLILAVEPDGARVLEQRVVAAMRRLESGRTPAARPQEASRPLAEQFEHDVHTEVSPARTATALQTPQHVVAANTEATSEAHLQTLPTRRRSWLPMAAVGGGALALVAVGLVALGEGEPLTTPVDGGQAELTKTASIVPDPTPAPLQPDSSTQQQDDPYATPDSAESANDVFPVPSAQPDPPATPSLGPLVVGALVDREIRAWNNLLVSDPTAGMTFEVAAAHCAALEVGGLTGWRVPTIGELNSLVTAKIAKKHVFWSNTPGDAFGDTRMVVNARKRSIAAVRVTWGGARVACIREHV